MTLQEWLEQESVGARDFAEKIGVDYASVTRYLTGKRTPNKATLRRIHEVTGGDVTPSDFFLSESA